MPGKIFSLPESVARFVPDGSSVALGCALEPAIPFAFAHELIRQGRRDLELIGPISDIAFDQLIGAGCVRGVTAAWIGNVSAGLAHAYRRAMEQGVPRRIEVHDLELLVRVLVEEKVQLVEGRTGHEPVVLLVEVVEDRRVGENPVERLGALAPGLFRETDRERAKGVETLDLFAQLRVLGLGRQHVAVVRRPATLARTGLAGHGHGRPPPRSGSPQVPQNGCQARIRYFPL